MVLERVFIKDFTLDEANTRKGEKPTRLDPGAPREMAINIKTIVVELKIGQLKKLKVGQTIKFKIEQDLTFLVPNRKIRDFDEMKEYVEGEGEGEILEIKDTYSLEDYDDDEEYEEVEIILSNGYAEQL